MRKSLGRAVLVITLFLKASIFASSYEWSVFVDKKNAYINEAIHLKYVCSFSDLAELYSVDFNPSGDYGAYRVELLKENKSVVDGKKINSYEFVLFAKEAREIEISFDATMKQTTRESIEEMVIGRDNVKKEEVIKKTIKQESFKLDIQETNSSLVGDFTLEVSKRDVHVKAYEPYHLGLTIRGVGNFDAIEALTFKIDGVQVFAGETGFKKELSSSGIQGEWSQKFAFVSDKNFTIPKVEITYFSLKNEKLQKLIIDAVDVNVESGFVKEELLDKVDDDEKWHFEPAYLYYLFAFVAGYIVAKVKINRNPKVQSKEKFFYKKIDDAASLDELMVLLVLQDAIKYDFIIKDIEAKRVTSLKKAKANACRV